jgi:hypothetical protein
MACACNGGTSEVVPAVEPQYMVSLPNGQTVVVQGEHAAKVEVTMAGGGSYVRR